MEMNKFYCCKGSATYYLLISQSDWSLLCLGNKPTLFTIQFLTGRHTFGGHETSHRHPKKLNISFTYKLPFISISYTMLIPYSSHHLCIFPYVQKKIIAACIHKCTTVLWYFGLMMHVSVKVKAYFAIHDR